MEAFLMEAKNIKQAFPSVDLNAAAITGARIKLDAGHRCAFVISMADSTSATAVTFTLRQHDAASSGNSKDLDVANPYYYKAGASTSFTKVVPTVADAEVDLTAIFADAEGVVVLEVLAEQLDINNGYAWFSVDIADAGAAKAAGGVLILSDLRKLPGYSQAV